MKLTVMSEHRVAYRHTNGEVEGFKGIGFGTRAARKDAMSQIERKLSLTADWLNSSPEIIDPTRLIEKPGHDLTRVQLNLVRLDWDSGVRY